MIIVIIITSKQEMAIMLLLLMMSIMITIKMIIKNLIIWVNKLVGIRLEFFYNEDYRDGDNDDDNNVDIDSDGDNDDDNNVDIDSDDIVDDDNYNNSNVWIDETDSDNDEHARTHTNTHTHIHTHLFDPGHKFLPDGIFEAVEWHGALSEYSIHSGQVHAAALDDVLHVFVHLQRKRRFTHVPALGGHNNIV